jgi:hypothetical protein
MSSFLPKHIETRIKDYVFGLADGQNYLSAGKSDNGQFMDRLVSDPQAGKLLEPFMGKDRIRTYIKDAILNRYTKQRRKQSKPSDLDSFFSSKLGVKCHKAEAAGETTFFRCEKGGDFTHVVSVDGTYMKWETALRKALLFAGNKPFSTKCGNKILIHLNLFTPNPVTDSDKNAIRKGLKIIGAECDFYGLL